MRLDFTPFVRKRFQRIAARTDSWDREMPDLQRRMLRDLLIRGAHTEYGKKYGFEDLVLSRNLYHDFAERVPLIEYEDIRDSVMRMIKGEENVLWPGRCVDFAQSSGTSGGVSKYVPITADSLAGNHYRGGEDTVAHYLRNVPDSKIFAGKGLILGGSFSNTLEEKVKGVNVGDLSATLINRINPFANFVRIPDKKTALMADWEQKLPAIVDFSIKNDVTNISGVPSWFLTVLRKIMEKKGVSNIKEVWPNLEVFFHGGISFEPYRDEYYKITEGLNMHFQETYNASEGFFAVQNDLADPGMLLIIDRNIFYEFIPVEGSSTVPLAPWEVEEGKVYEMVITASNGLWRYRLGDTVRIVSVEPLKIRIAGRTHSYINAFGEELMEDNAERAMSIAADRVNAHILNYTAAPLFSTEGTKARHQWLVEWEDEPEDIGQFAVILDEELRKLNSDYDAKRTGSIFLDLPEIITAREGLFDEWLRSAGNHKLGGQRKVPRLHNDRRIIENLLKMNEPL